APYMQAQNHSISALKLRDDRDAEASTDVRAAAMNGAQVTSLQGLMAAAALGEIPAESVRAAIAAAFPLLSAEQVDQMIRPILAAPKKPTPEPAPSDNDLE